MYYLQIELLRYSQATNIQSYRVVQYLRRHYLQYQ